MAAEANKIVTDFDILLQKFVLVAFQISRYWPSGVTRNFEPFIMKLVFVTCKKSKNEKDLNI